EVRWNEANTNASDLDHYDIRHSDDNSTWTVVNAGKATTLTVPGEPGDVRYFQVRAVDWTGNASAWSASVSGFCTDIGFRHFLKDESFEAGVSEWEKQAGDGSFSRSSTQAHTGTYSLFAVAS